MVVGKIICEAGIASDGQRHLVALNDILRRDANSVELTGRRLLRRTTLLIQSGRLPRFYYFSWRKHACRLERRLAPAMSIELEKSGGRFVRPLLDLGARGYVNRTEQTADQEISP